MKNELHFQSLTTRERERCNILLTISIFFLCLFSFYSNTIKYLCETPIIQIYLNKYLSWSVCEVGSGGTSKIVIAKFLRAFTKTPLGKSIGSIRSSNRSLMRFLPVLLQKKYEQYGIWYPTNIIHKYSSHIPKEFLFSLFKFTEE